MIERIPLPRIERFPVEAGHILIFARAIGDPNPIYSDPDYAAGSPLGGVIAPPTFLEAGAHFDLDFPFRPRLGQPWLGSGAEPTGRPEAVEPGAAMHAETHLEYHRQIRPGMVLRVDARLGRSWEAAGRRSGRLRFREALYDYRDQSSELVATNRTVILATERRVEPVARPEAAGGAPLPPSLTLPAAYPIAPPRLAELSLGLERKAVVASNLTRAQIIQYAGASGDVSPQHVDEVYNTCVAGYPSVFGHGMLTMSMVGRMLTDWMGDGALRKFGFQFRQQIWPGDSVIARGMVKAVDQGAVDLEIEALNQHGMLLGKGYAVARIAL